MTLPTRSGFLSATHPGVVAPCRLVLPCSVASTSPGLPVLAQQLTRREIASHQLLVFEKKPSHSKHQNTQQAPVNEFSRMK